MILDVKRGLSTIASIRIDDKTKLRYRLMGEEVINATFSHYQVISFQVGDFIEFAGEEWTLNVLPNVKKLSNHEYQYTAVFESPLYDLGKVQLLSGNTSDFNLYGNSNTFLQLIITNLNRVYGGSTWSIGDCYTDEYKNLYFSAQNCLQALQKICIEFNLEFLRDGKSIDLVQTVGENTAYSFEYGKGKGLYSLARQVVTSKNLVTRLYALGSTRNLKSDYRSYSERLMFDSGGNNYLEKNVGTYGLIELTKVFEECYPHRTGTISSVNGADELEFTDTGMNFDLNSYLLPGVSAKVHFQDGDCGGYEFELTSYIHGTKTFRIIRQTDERGFEMPNSTLKPAVGDKYVLVDIYLPQSYIDTAETELQTKAQAYLDAFSSPIVAYGLNLDSKYIKDNSITDLTVGDKVTVVDSDLGIDNLVRIAFMSQSIANPEKIGIELSENIEPQIITALYAEIQETERIINNSGVGMITKIRRWADGAFGKLLVRNDTAIQGGIAGTTGSGTSEIGLWLGGTYENRASAPFRVDHAGNLTAMGTIRTADETVSANQAVVINAATNDLKFYKVGSTDPVVKIGTSGGYNGIFITEEGRIKIDGADNSYTISDADSFTLDGGRTKQEMAMFTSRFSLSSFGTALTGTMDTDHNGDSTDAWVGVQGFAVGGTSDKYIGVRGLAGGFDAGKAMNYGVWGKAIQSGTKENVGVYGEASGATLNYAGYFSGNVKITGNLTVDGSHPGGIGWNGSTANAIGTYVDANTIQAEANLRFNGNLLDVYGLGSTDDWDNIIKVSDIRAQAAGVGGGITFAGKYTDAGASTAGGFIRLEKQNSTTGNYGFDLILGSRTHGSVPIEVMRLKDGNVGIGTASPAHPLQVSLSADYVSITDSGDADKDRVRLGDSSGNGGYMVLYDETEVIKTVIRSYDIDGVQAYFTAGNVGIGTATPDNRLHIMQSDASASSHGSSILTLEENDHTGLQFLTPNTKTQYIFFGDPESTSVGYIRYNHADNSMALRAGNQVNHLFLKGDGKVGIGTTSPTNTLHTVGPASFPANLAELEPHATARFQGRSATDTNLYISEATTSRQLIQVGNTTTAYDLLLNPFGGKVAIGTTSPTSNLDIYTATGDATLNLEANAGHSIFNLDAGGAGNDIRIQFQDDGANKWLQKFESTDGKLLFYTYVGESNLLTLTTDNRVGINDTTPSYTLDVNGTGRFTGILSCDSDIDMAGGTLNDVRYIQAYDANGIQFKENGGVEYWRMADNGDFHAEGDMIGKSSTVSDKKLKKNIKRIKGALGKVLSLEGVSFEYRKKKDGRHLGIIAQEIEKVIPEVVREKVLPIHARDNKKYKIVRYQEIIPVLIEAMKEQQGQIDELRNLLKSK